MASDVSLVETFSGVSQDKSSGANGASWTGDVCNWFAVFARRKSTDLINSKYATWLSMDTDADPRGYIKTTNLEGGIKYVEFPYAQFDTETDNFLKLEVRAIASSDGVTILKYEEETRGEVEDEGVNKTTGETYTWDCACKADAQLQIINTSVKRDGGGTPTSTNMPRWLVGNVKITPYLYYMQKSVTIGLPNKGYINRNLIDNTGETANIRYSIHDKNAVTKNVADIDENTGAITPKAAGTAVVTASWEGVTTTYELKVSANTYLETFSKGSPATALDKDVEQSWNNCGDVIPSWKVWETRRKADVDTILGQYVQGTQIRALANDDCTNGYIKSAAPVEGGVKKASMKWKQYGQANNTSLLLKAYFDGTEVGESLPHNGNSTNPRLHIWTFNPDFSEIANPTNPIFEIRNVSTKSGTNNPNIVISSITITPWLLYYTKEAELNMRVASADPTRTYTNTGLINNTEGTPTYSILGEPSISVQIDAESGEVTVADRFQTGDIMVQAKWADVTTKYTLHVKGKTASNASFDENELNKTYGDASFTNTLTKAEGSGTATYNSSDETVATVNQSGEVTILAGGDATITATIPENDNFKGAEISYTIHVAKQAITASFAKDTVHGALNGTIVNALTITPNAYDGNVTYSSSNPSVATFEGSTINIHGVGVTTITATIPETNKFQGTSVSYKLYITDANALKETFADITTGNAVANSQVEWAGQLFKWQALQVRRYSETDTIFPDKPGTWIRTSSKDEKAVPGYLQSKSNVEGGIKHLSFFWKQWGYENGKVLRLAVYAGNNPTEANRVAYMEANPDQGDYTYCCHEKFLLGTNDVMQSNTRLIIRNESYTDADQDGFEESEITTSNSRLIIDDIHITPWLLYTNKSKQTLRVDESYTREPDIDNTEGETGTLTYISSDPTVATVIASGENAGQVTGVGRGKATITAKFKWNDSEDYVTTTYDVEVFPVNCETFSVASTDNYYATNNNQQEDIAKWSTVYGGINTLSGFDANSAFIRAPRTDETKTAYIQSSAIEGGVASLSFDWNLVANESNINWDIRVFVNGREVKRLGNSDITASDKMENFEKVTISDINEPDNFTIRIENHTTFSDAYTSGNRGRFVIDNITWTSYDGSVKTLNDTQDNSGWLTANNSKTRDVNTTRVLVANAWNTLCMPFEISVSDLGDGADVQDLFGVEQDGDDLIFGFKPLVGDVLEAGHPYLVKPTLNVILTEFEEKIIVATPMTLTRGDYALVGVFSPLTLTNDSKTLFVGPDDGNGNNLYYPNSATGNLMNGFRAYFKKVSGSAHAPKRVRYVVNYNTTATGLEEISTQQSTISTQKILRDGQLYIIRDGRTYNAQGARVK